MPDWKILNHSERESVLLLLKNQWGFTSEFRFEIMRTPKDKLYITSKDVIKSDLTGLRIDRLGIYFGELMKGVIRLSIEGSQIIGPEASKNVLEISDDKIKKWLAGQEFDIDEKIEGFQIIKHNNDYMGCGKASKGILYNYVPKNRRLGTTE